MKFYILISTETNCVVHTSQIIFMFLALHRCFSICHRLFAGKSIHFCFSTHRRFVKTDVQRSFTQKNVSIRCCVTPCNKTRAFVKTSQNCHSLFAFRPALVYVFVYYRNCTTDYYMVRLLSIDYNHLSCKLSQALSYRPDQDSFLHILSRIH